MKDLHKGVDLSILKDRFNELIKDVSPTEISNMEQALIEDGIPENEVKRLCDLHVQVFKDSLDKKKLPLEIPGHPIHTFMKENRKAEEILESIQKLIDQITVNTTQSGDKRVREKLTQEINQLLKISIHYTRKENQLFPYLEAHDISGPSKVMWATHDDIRAILKEIVNASNSKNDHKLIAKFHEAKKMMLDMIYKEENILFPLCIETLSDSEWISVRNGEEDIGYSWISPGKEWMPKIPDQKNMIIKSDNETLAVSTGKMTVEQLDLMLTHLPVDLSFVNEKDEVAYYSDVPDRIFPRSPAVIGRSVQNCHPPSSVDKVQNILDQFRAGRKNKAEFWITLNERFLLIRYFAVRDRVGKYIGTLEVSQDITNIRNLKGEKRLIDWNNDDQPH